VRGEPMRIIMCDKCGKEIPQKEWIEIPVMRIEILESTVIKPKTIDLCDECQKELLSWLEKE
jgi:uncharacterized protein YlaI